MKHRDGNCWAWLSYSIVLEFVYHAEWKWHADPFSGDDLLQIDSDICTYDLYVRAGSGKLAW